MMYRDVLKHTIILPLKHSTFVRITINLSRIRCVTSLLCIKRFAVLYSFGNKYDLRVTCLSAYLNIDLWALQTTSYHPMV